MYVGVPISMSPKERQIDPGSGVRLLSSCSSQGPAALRAPWQRLAHGSVFAQRGHSVRTAPIITLFIPGTPLKTTHLQKDA